MENAVKRIGVLTSGGDAPGMNAAVRAVVRASTFRGIECIGIRRGYNGLINGDFVKLTADSVSHIINRGGTMLYTARSDEFRTLEGQKKAAATCKLLGLDGIVSIGGSNLSSDYIVPERIAAFKTKYPNVTLRASEASTIQCKQMLDAGDLDLVITNRPLDTESYERIVCYRENLLLAVPSHFAVNEGLRNYQLTQAERGEMIFLLPEERCAPLECFHDTPFILLHDGNYLRLCCERMFEENHFQPRLVMEMDRSMVAYNFARYGLGAAFISNVLVEHQPDDGSLVFYKPRSRHAVRDAYICYKKGRFVTSAMRGFIEMMVRK